MYLVDYSCYASPAPIFFSFREGMETSHRARYWGFWGKCALRYRRPYLDQLIRSTFDTIERQIVNRCFTIKRKSRLLSSSKPHLDPSYLSLGGRRKGCTKSHMFHYPKRKYDSKEVKSFQTQKKHEMIQSIEERDRSVLLLFCNALTYLSSSFLILSGNGLKLKLLIRYIQYRKISFLFLTLDPLPIRGAQQLVVLSGTCERTRNSGDFSRSAEPAGNKKKKKRTFFSQELHVPEGRKRQITVATHMI